MEFRIFTLPFDEVSESFPDEIITQFCLNKKVHDIQSHFFQEEGRHFWSVAIKYEVVLKGEDKIRALDDAQKLLYDRLKDWRREHANKEGIPVYLVATNAQFLQMVKLKCRTLESLKQVKGFGRKRMDKYGRHIVNLIKDFYDSKGKAKPPEPPTSIDDLPFVTKK
ncbi:MAG: HRDC domain-containing protein [Lewinellaceae bacterium]|nr:HRDC domain-containing protein [Lewinellaceae bacterium]